MASPPPAAEGAFAVELVEDGDGAIATWIEPRERGAAIRFSRFDGGGERAWTAPRTVAEREDLFANWADRPAVRRLDDGSLLAHELRKIAEGTYAYGIRISRSRDGGDTWRDLGWLHDDTRAVEHGFVSMLEHDGAVEAFWLDGREMAEQTPDGGHGHHDHGGGPMTLRTASIELGARPGSPSGPAADATTPAPPPSLGLDGRVCECCDTDVATAASGPLVVYRDRGPNEERDIFIVRRENGGWTSPAPVSRDGWIMPGCPVNGPAVAARDSDVCVAWFTAAVGDVESPEPPRVLAAWSADGGAAFASPIELSRTGVGRVDLVVLPDGDAIACWVDRLPPTTGLGAGVATGKGRGSIALRRIAADGDMGETVRIAPIHLGRLAGFPRLARLDGGTRLLLAWRDEDANRLQSLVIEPPTRRSAGGAEAVHPAR